MFGSSTSLTTIVGESTVIDGNIETKSTIRVDGTINGDVVSASGVIVSITGEVKGNIECPNNKVTINGALTGDVESEYITIGPKAVVEGKLKVKSISIEKGATINGSIDMVKVFNHPSEEGDERKSS